MTKIASRWRPCSWLNKREEAWFSCGMLSVTKTLVAKRRPSWRRIYVSVARGASSFAEETGCQAAPFMAQDIC